MASLSHMLVTLPRAVTLRCPHCRKGRLFRKVYALNERCPVCGLVFERDEGDFWGSVVINYTFGSLAGLAAAVAVALMQLGWEDWGNITYFAAGVGVATILLLFPFAKSLWIWLLFLTRGGYEEYRPPGSNVNDDT